MNIKNWAAQALFGKAISQQVQDQVNQVTQIMQQQQLQVLTGEISRQLQVLGGTTLYKDAGTDNFIRDGYAGNADLYAIIRLIAKTFAAIPRDVCIVKDEKAFKRFKSVRELAAGNQHTKMHNYSDDVLEDYYQLRRKALEAVGPDDEYQQFIDIPNPNEDAQQFYEGVASWLLLDGNSYVNFPIIPLGKNKGKPLGQYLMPPQYTSIISTNTFPRVILSYRLDVQGTNYVDSEDVLHLKYWNPYFSYDGQELLGLSPIKAMWLESQLSKEGGMSAYAMFKNGGPTGILYNEDIAADELGIGAAAMLQKNFNKQFAGSQGRGKVMLSPGKMGYLRTGLSPVDMDLDNNRLLSMGKLCNGYGVSDTLFNNHQSSTESNVKEMRVGLYTNAVLPLAYSWRDGMNRKVSPMFSQGNYRKIVQEDITGIPELQPDMGAMATWLAAAWWITPNQKLEMMKFEKNPDPKFDEPWVPSGIMPLSEAQMVDDTLDEQDTELTDENMM